MCTIIMWAPAPPKGWLLEGPSSGQSFNHPSWSYPSFPFPCCERFAAFQSLILELLLLLIAGIRIFGTQLPQDRHFHLAKGPLLVSEGGENLPRAGVPRGPGKREPRPEPIQHSTFNWYTGTPTAAPETNVMSFCLGATGVAGHKPPMSPQALKRSVPPQPPEKVPGKTCLLVCVCFINL